jgi:phosphoenolpyruvate carboxykinase (GTP)
MLVAKDRPTTNAALLSWVDDVAKMCKPDQIYWSTAPSRRRRRSPRRPSRRAS